jgi:hypothetical protein
MERRSFVKKSTLLSSIALLSSPMALVANDINSHSVDVSSLLTVGKKVRISGFTFDSDTKQAIPATIQVKAGYGLFSKTRDAVASSGHYEIAGKVAHDISSKIRIKVEAQGYKTFEGYIYLTSLGCRIHTDMWKYNPGFKKEFIPKNEVTAEQVESKFNFYLIKA